MYTVRFRFLFILLIVLTFLPACNAGTATADLPIDVPESFVEVLNLSEGRVSAFNLQAGISYDTLVHDIFSEDELDLQFYQENGKVTLKQPLAFRETGDEEWLISFFFVDDKLTRIAAGSTFLDTPLAEGWTTVAALKESYQAQFGDEVYFREQGPAFEELVNGDVHSYSTAEWLLDDGGVRLSAKNRSDLKASGITEQDVCVELSVIMVL